MAFGKMVTETIPSHLVSSFGMAHNASVCIGYIFCYGLGAILPDPEDMQANKDDELWRVIWLMPVFIGIIEIVLVLTVFR